MTASPPSARRRAALRAALLGAALLGSGEAHAQTPAVRGRLSVERSGEQWTFTVELEADRPAQVEYELRAAVDGAGGRSQNRQSGRARLSPGQPQRPSRSALRIPAGTPYCVTLEVRENRQLVASDRVASDTPGPAGQPALPGPAPCLE